MMSRLLRPLQQLRVGWTLALLAIFVQETNQIEDDTWYTPHGTSFQGTLLDTTQTQLSNGAEKKTVLVQKNPPAPATAHSKRTAAFNSQRRCPYRGLGFR
jgi:hypothetical protein